MMKYERCRSNSDTLSRADEKPAIEDYVWSTSEKARLRALSLYIIRSIVEQHKGTIEIDLATDTINIGVPEENRLACAQEIAGKVGSTCR
jgi:hypothetical protein